MEKFIYYLSGGEPLATLANAFQAINRIRYVFDDQIEYQLRSLFRGLARAVIGPDLVPDYKLGTTASKWNICKLDLSWRAL